MGDLVRQELRNVIATKCLGRRICSQCGGNFNLANIDMEGSNGEPSTMMPPLWPPPACADKMTIRPDYTEEGVRARLHVYHVESDPVEGFYRTKGNLLDFNVGGGIPETWPNLLAALNVHEKKTHPGSAKKLAA